MSKFAPLESRTAKIDITISEHREGQYGDTQVGSHQIIVNLPVSAKAIGDAVAAQVIALAQEVEAFRGSMPVQETAVVTD